MMLTSNRVNEVVTMLSIVPPITNATVTRCAEFGTIDDRDNNCGLQLRKSAGAVPFVKILVHKRYVVPTDAQAIRSSGNTECDT